MLKRLVLAAALALGLCAPPALAASTIYFAGGEDVDFTLNGTVTVRTTAGDFRSAWARSALQVGNSTTVADPPANRFTTPTFTSVSALWVHAEYFGNSAAGTSGEQGIIVRSPDGVSRLIVRQTGTSGTLKLSKRNAAGTITDLATATVTFSANTLTALDIQIDYSASPGGVNLYIAGVLAATFSGDPRTDAATQLNQVDFAGLNNSSSGVNEGNEWSEIIVADSDTRGKGLWLMNTSSAGNADQWTGTLANVNKSTISDGTLISSGTNNQIQEYLIATAPTGTYAVDAVVMSARALVGATGPQHFGFVTRTGGSDSVSSDQAPSTSFSNFINYIQATNPNGGGAWALSDLTAAGVNYGVKSTP